MSTLCSADWSYESTALEPLWPINLSEQAISIMTEPLSQEEVWELVACGAFIATDNLPYCLDVPTSTTDDSYVET